MDRYFSREIAPSYMREITPEEKKQIEANKAKAEKRRNPYGFNFRQVSEEDIIRVAIESGVAVFLHGQSSEGKSSRVKQIDPDCVIIYLRNATPESLNSKSVYNSETGEMIDVKPTWLKKLEDRCEKEPDKYLFVIYAYIAYKKGESLKSKYDGEKPNADPRKWEMASKMLYATGQPEMLRALVGEEITREFCQFCNQRVITLDNVLEGNYTERDLQMNTSEIYATAMGLSQVDEANFTKVREFVLKLGGEPCAIFESLWTHGDEARMEVVAEARLENSR